MSWVIVYQQCCVCDKNTMREDIHCIQGRVICDECYNSISMEWIRRLTANSPPPPSCPIFKILDSYLPALP